MATAKIATLVIRTLAKPIATQIKQQAKEHPTFRSYCVSLAQNMHRAEVKLRTNLLGDNPKSIRPLSEARAIENGANAIAEGFLFGVAAALIIGESWRSSRSSAKRRDAVDERLEELSSQVEELSSGANALEARLTEEQDRSEGLRDVISSLVDAGLRSGWAELRDTPLKQPRIQVIPSPSDDEMQSPGQ